ncbi:MAG: molybdenum ABC transporter ATP-binding protein [Proteobacteria bacterium]|nr:molybdenum ABC transporter ATP-binding protein [Pseudomonadota bacterium]
MIEVDIERRVPGFELSAKFSAPAGVTTLFGASGAGKTMIVNMIAGLARPDRGRITIAGRTLFDSEAGVNLPPEKRRLGYVFQEPRLFPHMSVAANLRYGMRLVAEAERTLEFDPVVGLLGLGPLLKRLPHRLSGGETQRVAIGRALLASPRLLLMDEPLASLDDQRRGEILPFIENVSRTFAVPVIYVTHALDEVTRLADTVVLVSAGRIEAVGPVGEIMARLDLRQLTERRDAGAVLDVTVESHDDADGLTALTFAGGRLTVPRLQVPPGTALRLRVQARDVALALEAPKAISTLNILRGTVMEVGDGQGPQTNVLVDVGAPLFARLTRRSVRELGLEPGRTVYALIKSVAVDWPAGGGETP